MGRDATKATGNQWYEARKRAAKFDPRLESREGAAELLGMSVAAVADAELGASKCMPVDKAILMAELYKQPHLLNHYCLNECPIGWKHSLSEDVVSIELATVKLVNLLRPAEVEDVIGKLVLIASDGSITEDEREDLKKIVEYFDRLAYSISELKIIAEMSAERKKKDVQQ